jgi:hypothetical protein
MSTPLIDKYVQAFLQTLAMVSVSAFIAIALGLVLAVVLTVTAPATSTRRALEPRAVGRGHQMLPRDSFHHFAGRAAAGHALGGRHHAWAPGPRWCRWRPTWRRFSRASRR